MNSNKFNEKKKKPAKIKKRALDEIENLLCAYAKCDAVPQKLPVCNMK